MEQELNAITHVYRTQEHVMEFKTVEMASTRIHVSAMAARAGIRLTVLDMAYVSYHRTQCCEDVPVIMGLLGNVVRTVLIQCLMRISEYKLTVLPGA